MKKLSQKEMKALRGGQGSGYSCTSVIVGFNVDLEAGTLYNCKCKCTSMVVTVDSTDGATEVYYQTTTQGIGNCSDGKYCNWVM